MPVAGVSEELKGVEAIAFRVEDGTNFRLCGMGGREENCKPGGSCMLDIYVDESSYPLPWREPDQRADWINQYTSQVWLKAYEDPDKSTTFTPAIGKRGTATLHPFVDPKSTLEAGYTQKNPEQRGTDWGKSLRVAGFRRKAVGQLTVIAFIDSCSRNFGELKPIYLSLESRDSVGAPALATFHEIEVPLSFVKTMESRIAKASDEFARYVRSLGSGDGAPKGLK
jgi:hypothetical protein